MDGQQPRNQPPSSPKTPPAGSGLPQRSRPQPRLVREVMEPFRRFHLGTFTFVTSGLLALATGVIMVGARSLPGHEASGIAPAVAEATPVELDRTNVAAPSFEAPAPIVPANADFVFVVDTGKRRFALLRSMDDTETKASDHLGRHRGAELLGDADYPTGGVMPLDQETLPADIEAWRGRDVTVANTCTAHVGDIVHVSLVTGDPDYYYGGAEPAAQDPFNYVFDGGHHYYAAEVTSCGTGEWGRMSDLSQAETPVDLGAAPVSLRAEARTTLLRSAASSAVQARWREQGRNGEWYQDAAYDSLSLEFRYVLHPRTGQRWLVVHATGDFECGGVMANLLGVFRVSRDGHIQDWSVREVEPVSIDELIDIDGDGRFELRASTWLSGPVLINGLGEVEAEAEIPFYGCPC